jgi:hypothetical protein
MNLNLCMTSKTGFDRSCHVSGLLLVAWNLEAERGVTTLDSIGKRSAVFQVDAYAKSDLLISLISLYVVIETGTFTKAYEV